MTTAVQTSISDTAGVAYPGMQSDTAPARRRSAQNADAAALLSGVFAAFNAEGQVRSLASATDVIAGIILHSHARNNVLGQAGWEVGAELPVLENGGSYMLAEETMAVGDAVYARIGTGGGGSVPGFIRNDSDSGTCVLVKGARVDRGGTIPAIVFDKAVQAEAGDSVEMSYAFAAASATTTFKVAKPRADRHFVLDEAWVEIPATGVTADPSNKFVLAVKLGAASAATYDTGATAITADTFTQLTNGTQALRTAIPGAEIDLVATLTGTKTLPTGTLHIKGHYV